MEQKKTLWIIAAVGVFLLVVLGVPAILHYPSRNPVPAYASISPVEKKTSQGGWTKPASEVEAAKEETEGTEEKKDLRISNVIMNISNENTASDITSHVLSIYIGFYHPTLGNKYAINIVSPINYQ